MKSRKSFNTLGTVLFCTDNNFNLNSSVIVRPFAIENILGKIIAKQINLYLFCVQYNCVLKLK